MRMDILFLGLGLFALGVGMAEAPRISALFKRLSKLPYAVSDMIAIAFLMVCIFSWFYWRLG